jgi:pSer/pThr/pTyr-binding forkhead associated (FHA) protein
VVSSSTRTEIFPTGGTLRLEIEGSPEPIYLGLNHREIVLGRRDPATGALPDVDLTPFAGYRMGVSRRHSQIRHSEEGHLDVFDLGSSNGTFLNGRRLEAHYPYRLRDGDKLALGQIVIRVYFEKSADEAEAAPAAPVLKGTGTKPLADEAPASEPAKPPVAAQPPAQQAAAKPADGAVKQPEPAKPTTVMPGSSAPLQAPKSEEKAAQPPSPPAAPVASEQPKTEAAKPASPAASKPEEAKKPETEQPKQPQSSAAPSSGTVSKPAESKPETEKPKQPQPSTSPPLGTVTRPAGTKPEAEKSKPPFTTTDGISTSGTTAAKPEAQKSDGNTSTPKKAEEGDDKKEPSSKPDSSTKPSE